MIFNHMFKVKSSWLPDISYTLLKSLKKRKLLVVTNNTLRTGNFKKKFQIKIDPRLFNVKDDFEWIMVDNYIYKFSHFKQFYPIINTYALAYTNIKAISFCPNLKPNIYAIYLLIFSYLRNIPIIDYGKVTSDVYLVSNTINPDYSNNPKIYLGRKKLEGNFIQIIFNNRVITDIYRDGYLIYNYLNCDLNQYSLSDSLKCKLSMIDFYHIENCEYLTEELITLPNSILFKFIKSCYLLLIQYPILSYNYNYRFKTLENNVNPKVIKLIWLQDNSKINFDIFIRKNLSKTKLFYLFLFIDLTTNQFTTRIYFNSYLVKYAPFTEKIYYNFQQTNTKVLAIPLPTNLNQSPTFNINTWTACYLVITLLSLLMKSIIAVKTNSNYDKLKIKIHKIDINKFITKFSKLYFRQTFYYPIIVIWDPYPRINFKKFQGPGDTMSLNIIVLLILLTKTSFNFIHQNIIHIRIIKKNKTNWLKKNCVLLKHQYNLNKNQYLVITKHDNQLEIEGQCSMVVRKIIDHLKITC